MQVHLDMDEGWTWWPTPEGSYRVNPLVGDNRNARIEIPDALFSRFEELRKEWYGLQNDLEHLYRHQEGLRAFPGSPYFVDEKEEQNVETQS